MTAADAVREVTMGTCDETGDAAEVFELMGELRCQLLDRLETREDRQDTVMVALINLLLKLRMQIDATNLQHRGDGGMVAYVRATVGPVTFGESAFCGQLPVQSLRHVGT